MSYMDYIIKKTKENEELEKEPRQEIDDELDLLRDSFDKWILVE